MTLVSPDNLPSVKDEAWKFTNLPKALPKNLTRAEDEAPIVIHKNGGQPGGEKEDIVFTGRDGMLQSPVIKVKIEDGAEATIIERHDGAGAYWKNMDVQIEIGANARLRHYRVLNDGAEGVCTINTHITQGVSSVYDGFYLLQGGALVRNEFHAEIQGAGAECNFNGLNFLKNKQHGDTTILVEHQAPHCASNQYFRTILDDHARGVFQGKVHVHQIAQKTDGYQLSNAIMLSEQAEMDTKPELEIYADDVKCSHGATTGQLDEEPLFYLRSRGLSEAAARMLLIQAFVDDVADKIGDEAFQAEVKREAEQWLQSVL